MTVVDPWNVYQIINYLIISGVVPAGQGANLYIQCKAVIKKEGEDAADGAPLPNARPALFSIKLKRADE